MLQAMPRSIMYPELLLLFRILYYAGMVMVVAEKLVFCGAGLLALQGFLSIKRKAAIPGRNSRLTSEVTSARLIMVPVPKETGDREIGENRCRDIMCRWKECRDGDLFQVTGLPSVR